MRSNPGLGNLRCGSVVLTTTAYEARQLTWETLKQNHYHVCWHPQFVDYAINRCPGARSIEAIVRCPAFLRACQQFCRSSTNGLRDMAMTPRVLMTANQDPRQSLVDCYLNSQLARVIGELNAREMSESDREETKAKLKHVFFRNAERFQTAASLPDGSFRTYGYNAFHSSYIRSAWDAVIEEFCPTVRLNGIAPSAGEEETPTDSLELECLAGAASSRSDELALIGESLVQALRHALDDQLSWDIFYGMMYVGADLTELEETLGISRAYLSGTVNSAILAKLRIAISDIYKPLASRTIRISELRDPLLDFVPEDEFLRMVPRPKLQSGRVLSKKAFAPQTRGRSLHR